MDEFIKGAGLIFIAVVLCIVLASHAKNYTVIVTLAVCCMVSVIAIGYLEPVISFFQTLQKQGGWNGELTQTLLKAVGIGLISDIAVLICNDSGQSALGKAVGLLSGAAMLWLSLPLFSGLIELISNILDSI